MIRFKINFTLIFVFSLIFLYPFPSVASKRVGMITNVEGSVLFKNRQDSTVDFGSDVYQGDELIIQENANLTVTYYSGCRQDEVGENSIVEIGLTQSIVKKGSIISSEIVNCEVPKIILDSNVSHLKGGVVVRKLNVPVKALGCNVNEKSLPREEKRDMAIREAKNKAIVQNNSFRKAVSKLEKYRVKEYVLRTIGAAYLHNLKTLIHYEKGRETCVLIEVELDSEEVNEVVKWVIYSTKQTEKVRAPVLPRDNDFEVKIWTHKGEDSYFRDGEKAIINVRSEKDAYLRLDYYQVDGKVVHLVPGYLPGNFQIKAKQTYTLGDQNSGFELKVSPPFGVEIVKVIASTAPFDENLNRKTISSSVDPYLNGLKEYFSKISRNIKLAEASVTIRTMP